MADNKNHIELEQRVQRLELELAALQLERPSASPPQPAAGAKPIVHPVWPLLLGLPALGCGLLGLGLPQHYYQPLFAFLLLLLAYHRQVCQWLSNPWRWPLAIMNFFLLCLFFKLLLGGGTEYPLGWFKMPTMTPTPPAANEPWYQHLLPGYQLTWQGIPGLSDWFVNLTRIQALLVITTLAGALFRFQPFASIAALALLVLSIPSFLGFSWDWVILFLVLGGSTLYLQSPPTAGRLRGD